MSARRSIPGTVARAVLVLLLLVSLAACERDSGGGAGKAASTAAPGAAGTASGTVSGAATGPAASAAPLREPLAGGPYPALLVTQAQFTEKAQPDGKTQAIPGAAKLLIVRKTESGWKTVTLEDPDSNAFHKALAYDGGFLTIGATQAMLKVWRFSAGAWQQETHWNPKFGGKFDRLRDIERGNVDGEHTDDLVIATHDQGVIAVVHPADGWRVEEIDHQPDTFVHEIELGDVDGDGVAEILTMPGPDPVATARLRGWNVDGGPVTPLAAFDFTAYDAWMTYGGRVAVVEGD